jgi:hypothetical protein
MEVADRLRESRRGDVATNKERLSVTPASV